MRWIFLENLLVSIIIPVYCTDRQKFEHCIQSVQRQSYSNLEILIVDDGSDINTANMLDSYAKEDKRIRVIHTENNGAAVARTIGLKASTGEYVAFVDSDDIFDISAIEILLYLLITSNADMAFGNMKTVSKYPQMNAAALTNIKTKEYSKLEVLEQILIGSIGSTPCCRLTSKEIWGDQPFIPGHLHEDLASMWVIFERCNKVICCQDNLYYYYFSGSSSVHKKKPSEKYCLDFWSAFIERRNQMLSCYSQFNEADAYSCIYYCPQIYSAIQLADKTQRLRKIEKESIKLFLSKWEEAKIYARSNDKAIAKYYLFYVSPVLYNLTFVFWRLLHNKRL